MFNYETMPALNLNQSTISAANNMSMFDAGNTIAKEAQRVYRAGLAAMFKDMEAPNAAQEKIMQERAESWRELCEKSFNDELSRRASWVPWTVSGPANYPAAKMNKKADRAIEAAREWNEKRAHFVENTLQMLRKAVPLAAIIEEYRTGKNNEPISADDPAAAEKLAARIEFLKGVHEEGKARNAYWRKHHTMKGYKDWTDEKAAKIDESLNSDRAMYHVPYAPFEVSNNNANIKRLEDRLKDIQRMKEKAADMPQTTIEYDGFSVRYSAEDCRINIDFASKPEEDARDILKSNGFHWSPREKTWTRKFTANADWSVKHHIIPALLKLDAYDELPPEEQEPAQEPTQETAQKSASVAPLSLETFAAQYSPEVYDDCEAFVNSLILSSAESREPMTVNDALVCFTEWVKEGIEIPGTLTAEKLAKLWNAGIADR